MRYFEYSPGALVNVRGRDWIVLPYKEPDVLRLRPLTGGDGSEVGLYLPIEADSITPATFALNLPLNEPTLAAQQYMAMTAEQVKGAFAK